jgi:tetrahydromethanopterin S-methyltransferase subunit B
MTGTTLSLSMFTGLFGSGDVTSSITNYGIVIGAVIIAMLALSPLFFAKQGFQTILQKIQHAVGAK